MIERSWRWQKLHPHGLVQLSEALFFFKPKFLKISFPQKKNNHLEKLFSKMHNLFKIWLMLMILNVKNYVKKCTN